MTVFPLLPPKTGKMSLRSALPTFSFTPRVLLWQHRVFPRPSISQSSSRISAGLYGASCMPTGSVSLSTPVTVSSEMPRLQLQKNPFREVPQAGNELGFLSQPRSPLNGVAFEKVLALFAGTLESRIAPSRNPPFLVDKKTFTSTRKQSSEANQPGNQTAATRQPTGRSENRQENRMQENNLRSAEQSTISSPEPGNPNFSRGALAAGKRRRERTSALRVCENFLDAVGMTPLIYLRRASQETHCDIFAKCEFNNPGGSVKDRPAKYILEQAEKEGRLGGSQNWIVEGSAGNTAIGLALASKPRGYRVVCVIPDTQTQDKKDMLKVCGALVVEVPFHKVWHPDHFVAFSGRLASVMNACWGNQFDNLANQLSHYETTGPEIWDQMDGRIDGFVSAAGTGGTVSGVSRYLRSQHPEIQIALADIPGSALYRYFTEGVLRAEGASVVENIGQGRITGQLQDFRPDVAFEISDVESLTWTHSLLEDEGLAVGMSSGVNVAAAVRLAKRLGPGHRICTILCDSGTRYAKKQWNISFLREEGLPYPRLLADQKREMSAIMEAIHVAYAPQHVVERIEKEHENDISAPGSKL
ncbi:putative O-acetylserine (thiol) lyase 2 [Toxoplasma gondii TgCatPRC2]|uniref:O-acetylserine (Thiol) lyase 2 n=3 Tax=Toxoplasma gondii TaxID=5811 RepID=A0A125YSK2_TOXGV|nr:O-acetylserine (thiol) lyase 2, putative [Toxoplasma gondii ME49]EPT25274.1 O-acetylserine (thiol) lyase 2, putative [Toxoplasma gondii ME49]ESS34586.1 putative O-acetylserine (thiol) lyase 2 [Toxoplasma gondii VEG]KYK65351.1 putative O-acetylserine (thiol) lyase 2 [Toxoplasma gondii TgCatPRC2]|eukprot:XP_018635109.1 O-acetylserine (thiol) lyase 2, putative [Toxoplasma gondii ME49]